MAEEPEKPKPLNICEVHDAMILTELLGIIVSFIRIRNEDFFEKPDDRFLCRCDWIKEKFGIACDTGFRNYVEAVEALTEFEKKYCCKEIKVPGPLEFGPRQLRDFYVGFEDLMQRHTFFNNEINRDILTLILKAVNSLH